MNQESRTNKFIKNILGSIFLQIVTIAVGFITPQLMLRTFGSEINGIVSSIAQFVSYIALVEAGLGNAVVYALYKPLAGHNTAARDRILAAAKISYNRVGVIFVILGIVLALLYPFIGKTSMLSYWELVALVAVLCLNGAVNFFILAKYRAILTADQCGYLISISSAIQILLHLGLIYGMIKLGFNIILVRGVPLSSLFVTSIILWVILRCKYGEINFNATPNMAALNARWDAMFLQILGVIQNGAPVIIMTKLLDFKVISVYAVYSMLAGSVASCITVFTSGLGAAFGDICALNDRILLKQTTENFRAAFYTFISIVYATMLSTFLPFMKLYTNGIDDTNYILPVFAILVTVRGILQNISAPFGMLIFSSGKFRVVRRMNIISLIFTIGLGTIFTKIWGIYGIMIALCVADLYSFMEYLYIVPRNIVSVSIKNLCSQICRVLFLVFLSCLISYKLENNVDSFGAWFVYTAVIFIFMSIIAIVSAIIFDHQNISALYNRLLLILRKNQHKRI